MPENLERLTLRNGKFFNQKGRLVKARILGIDLAIARNMAGSIVNDPKPVFQGHEIPAKTNAFVQGDSFDENAGAWSNFPRFVAPTLYLKVGK